MSYSKYYLYKKQVSNDNGVTWEDVTPLETAPSGESIGSYSTLEECSGSTPPPTPEPQYRTTSGSPYCSEYDKYVDVYSQVSYDSGTTWTTTATTATMIEHNSEDCGYVPPTPSYSGQYLTLVAEEDGTFTFQLGTLSSGTLTYSTDSGSTWITQTPSVLGWISVSVNSGDTVMWRGNLIPKNTYSIGKIKSTGRFHVEGNIMSLLYGKYFSDKTSLNYVCVLQELFVNCANLTSAENMLLPATSLNIFCYNGMFAGCTSLTKPPRVLPATSLASYCYQNMFAGCTSLTTTPILSATTLANNCYSGMFASCKNLTTAPALSATTLAEKCCLGMFRNCTSLTTAPELPVTTLVDYCYQNMFNGCTSLTTAPELPATTLANYCYSGMFYGCTSLTTAPTLPATSLFFNNCYEGMFGGCTSLNSITCLATSIPPSEGKATYNWVNGVAASGTFTKAASMTSWTTGDSGIPSGWTVVDAT